MRPGFSGVLSFRITKFATKLFLRPFGQGPLNIWAVSMEAIIREERHFLGRRVDNTILGLCKSYPAPES